MGNDIHLGVNSSEGGFVAKTQESSSSSESLNEEPAENTTITSRVEEDSHHFRGLSGNISSIHKAGPQG